MSAILDLITGGGLLPHVYCKKVTIETHPEDSDYSAVNLDFELYQLASNLSESNWLNKLNVLGADIYDFVFIQIIPFSKPENVKKLFASHQPSPPSAFPVPPQNVGNVYVLQHQAGDGHLPRKNTGGWGSQDSTNKSPMFPVYDKDLYDQSPVPIRVKNSAAFSSLSATNDYLDYEDNNLPPREEIKNGQPYYVLPFKQTYKIPNSTKNLGFLFYTMLDIVRFVEAIGMESDLLGVDLEDSMLERYVIEGPVNTEIVFKDGGLAQTREVFTLSDGTIW